LHRLQALSLRGVPSIPGACSQGQRSTIGSKRWRGDFPQCLNQGSTPCQEGHLRMPGSSHGERARRFSSSHPGSRPAPCPARGHAGRSRPAGFPRHHSAPRGDESPITFLFLSAFPSQLHGVMPPVVSTPNVEHQRRNTIEQPARPCLTFVCILSGT
jgi:hypothetical protein